MTLRATRRRCSSSRMRRSSGRSADRERIYARLTWQPQLQMPMNIYGTTPELPDGPRLARSDCWRPSPIRCSQRCGRLHVGQTVVKPVRRRSRRLAGIMRIQNVSFRVVGAAPRRASVVGMDQDDIVLAPWTFTQVPRQWHESPPIIKALGHGSRRHFNRHKAKRSTRSTICIRRS